MVGDANPSRFLVETNKIFLTLIIVFGFLSSKTKINSKTLIGLRNSFSGRRAGGFRQLVANAHRT